MGNIDYLGWIDLKLEIVLFDYESYWVANLLISDDQAKQCKQLAHHHYLYIPITTEQQILRNDVYKYQLFYFKLILNIEETILKQHTSCFLTTAFYYMLAQYTGTRIVLVVIPSTEDTKMIILIANR